MSTQFLFQKVVAEFRKEIDEEAKESGKDKLSLSAAVSRKKDRETCIDLWDRLIVETVPDPSEYMEARSGSVLAVTTRRQDLCFGHD